MKKVEKLGLRVNKEKAFGDTALVGRISLSHVPISPCSVVVACA